ncbi:MAG TPA: hypothetical protein VMV19_09275 [Xanthobacteraceae bacterium]|nr:hypothetical protein [Xanthobacteraceae bacterium]
MTDAPEPIPPIWCENFGLAADKLYTWPLTWHPGSEEPILIIEGERFTIGDVCNHVIEKKYSEETPDSPWENVLEMAKNFQGSDEALGFTCESPRGDRSYVNVARCLLQLYNAYKAHFENKDRKRKDSEA